MKSKAFVACQIFGLTWIVALGCWFTNWAIQKADSLRPAYDPGTIRTVGGPQ